MGFEKVLKHEDGRCIIQDQMRVLAIDLSIDRFRNPEDGDCHSLEDALDVIEYGKQNVL